MAELKRMSEEKNQKPKATFRNGGLKATVWENKDKDGKVNSSVVLTKSYKDGDEWKETKTLFASDLPKAVSVLNCAYEFLSIAREINE